MPSRDDKVISLINLSSYHGDTFVSKAKLFGMLREDLADKDRKFLDNVLFQAKASDPFIRSMAKINYCSPKKLFVGMSEDVVSYFQSKLDEERPDEPERNARTATSTFSNVAIYLTKNFYSEIDGANMFAKRIGEETTWDFPVVPDDKFTVEQKAAVQKAFSYRTSVITGSAGCGKTAVVSEIVRIAHEAGKRIVVLAPSAKAALHAASEIRKTRDKNIDIPYATIHRFAKVLPEDADAGEAGDYLKAEDIIGYDFVIIDEMSMCELTVFNRVLKTLEVAKKTHLVLVGDPMQIPAIGPQVFHQLADGVVGDLLPISHLTKNFRADSDALAEFGETIRSGNFSIPNSGSIFFESSSLKKFIEKHEVLLADEDTMFLTQRKEDVALLNRAIRAVRHPDSVAIEDTPFYIGDRVITIQNDYYNSDDVSSSRHPERTFDIYNGTDGIVEDYDAETDTVTIRMYAPDFPAEGKLVCYKKNELSIFLIPAFAETVHKAQGSQFRRVIFFLSDQKVGGLSRNLLYTAVTRAEKELCLIGKKEQFEASVKRMAHFGTTFFAFRVRNALQNASENEEQVSSEVVVWTF